MLVVQGFESIYVEMGRNEQLARNEDFLFEISSNQS